MMNDRKFLDDIKSTFGEIIYCFNVLSIKKSITVFILGRSIFSTLFFKDERQYKCSLEKLIS